MHLASTSRVIGCAASLRHVGVVLAACLVAVVVNPRDARARPHTRLLHARDAVAGHCPDALELRGKVAEKLGYDPFRSDAQTALRVVFKGTDEGLAAEVESFDSESSRTGFRSLSSPDRTCRDLAESTVLTISLLIDSPLARTEPTSTSTPTPTTSIPAAHPRADIAETSPPEPRWSTFLAAQSVVGIGFAPAPSVGFWLGAGLRRGAFSAWLGGRVDLPSERAFVSGTAQTSVRLGEASGCGHVGPTFFCLLVAGGAISADGSRVLNARPTIGPFGSLGGRAGADLALYGPVSLRASADVLLFLVRTTIEVGKEPLWTSPAGGAALSLGLVGHL